MDEEQVIDIPGVGEVAFPATMTEEEVSAAAHRLFLGANPAAAARDQATNRPAEYLRETAGNLKDSAWNTGRDMLTGAWDITKTVAGATGELGSATGNAVREMVGLQPNYPVPENLEKLAGMVPAAISHYAGYFDGDERARRVRDNPVGTAMDLVPVVPALRGASAGVKAAPGVVKNIAKHPVTGFVLDATPGIGGARQTRVIKDVLDHVAKDAKPVASHTPAVVTPKPPADPMAAGMKAMGEQGRKAYEDAAASDRMIAGMRRPTPSPGMALKSPAPKPSVEDALIGVLDDARKPMASHTPGGHTPRGETGRTAPALEHSLGVAKAQRPGAAAAPEPAAPQMSAAPLDWRQIPPDPNSRANFVKPYADKTQTDLAQMLAERDLGFKEKGAHIKQIKKPIYPEGSSQTDKLVAAIRQREHVMGGPQDTLTAGQLTGPQLTQLLLDTLKQRQLKP